MGQHQYDHIADQFAVRSLERRNVLIVGLHITKTRAKSLIRKGWAKLNPDGKRLGITDTGRLVACDPLTAGEANGSSRRAS